MHQLSTNITTYDIRAAGQTAFPMTAIGKDLGMPKKHRYSAKEHRQVEHIKESVVKARGVSAEEAEGIGYATVNKLNPSKHRHTAKEKRQVEHIIESEEARGKSEAEAKRIGYATVHKRST
jgi:polyhydroxyalkanoate synthesis regulator phasin